MKRFYLKVIYKAFENQATTVYEGEYRTRTPDEIYRDFNSVDGSDREMTGKLRIRSMSVGDLIMVGTYADDGKVEGTLYRCSPLGWSDLGDFTLPSEFIGATP